MTRRVTHIGIVVAFLAAVMARPATGVAQTTTAVVHAASAPRAPHGDSVYSELQVEEPVQPLPGARPTYPAALSAAHVEGKVLVEFVVDTLGRPEPETLKVLEVSHPPFADAVRDALPAMRFTPAKLHGHAVRQLVQQPFVFTLD